MARFFTFLVLVLLSCGCVRSVPTSAYAPVEVGDRVTITEDADIYACEIWGSTWRFFFSGPKTVRCLKIKGSGLVGGAVFGSVPRGTTLRVLRILEEGSIDGFGVRVLVARADTGEKFFLGDENGIALLRIAKDGP